MKILFYCLLIDCFIISADAQTLSPEKPFPIITDSFPNYDRSSLIMNNNQDFTKNKFEKVIRSYTGYLNQDPFGDLTSVILYNRGLCYYKMLDTLRACADFKFAGYLGNKSANLNYQSFCDSSKQAYIYLDSGYVYTKSSKNRIDDLELPDNPPEFPGGLDSLNSYFIRFFGSDYMRQCNPGSRMVFKIIINAEGVATLPENDKKVRICENEIGPMVESMPKWKPAIKNNFPVSCTYLFPIVNRNAFNVQLNKMYQVGIKLMNEQNFKSAIDYFNTVLYYDSKDADAFSERANCYFNLNDTSSACQDWAQSYLVSGFKKSVQPIYSFCDSSVVLEGKRIKINSVEFKKLNTVYTVVEQMPSFPGGDDMLMQHLSRIRYPIQAREKNITGRVYVTFIVDRTGKIRDTKVLRGIGGGCDEAAVEIVKSMPDWIPGKQNGQNVDVQFNLPINFNINNYTRPSNNRYR